MRNNSYTLIVIFKNDYFNLDEFDFRVKNIFPLTPNAFSIVNKICDIYHSNLQI